MKFRYKCISVVNEDYNFGPDIGLFIVDNNDKLQTYPISGQTIFSLTDIDLAHIPIPMFGFENAKRLSSSNSE